MLHDVLDLGTEACHQLVLDLKHELIVHLHRQVYRVLR